MSSVLIITQENESAGKIQSDLSRWGFTCLKAGMKERIVDRVVREAPQLVILEMDGAVSQAVLNELVTSSKIRRKAPVLALMTTETLSRVNNLSGIDDFILRPYDEKELLARTRRLIQRYANQSEILQCGDMEIDLANCEVRVEGKIVELTFKEFELLKFLAQDKGRVFTREALLNKVWGYDYFGGDRTVDVHIRRLRSKIELTGKPFIETVRNIGYRFSKNC